MKRIPYIFTIILLIGLIAACSPKAEPVVDVLFVSGLKEAAFSQAELESMPMVDSNYTNKDGETSTFSGVAISGLLTEAGLDKFSNLSLIASDGYSADVSSEELNNCAGCILSYSSENGWSAIMPDFSGKLQVKDVVELTVK